MSVIDDITALLTPVLHTNTTKDITAAAVKAALISAFTDIVNDVDTKETATLAAANAAKALAPAEARSAINFPRDLLGTDGARAGQGVFGLQNVRPMIGQDGRADAGWTSSWTPDVVGSAVGWVVSGFIPVIPGSTMTVGIRNASGLGGGINTPILFYKSDKTTAEVAGVGAGAWPSAGNWVNGENFIIPSNVYFVRWAGPYNLVHRISLYQGDIDAADIPAHKWLGQAATVNMFRPWTGRRFMYCGDSIGAARAGNSWVSDVAKYHGFAFFDNNSMDGGTTTTIMDKWNRPTNYSRVPLTAGDLTPIHLLVCYTGVNDVSIGRPVGTINDADTADTYIGHYRKFIEFVLTSNPTLKLVLTTPMGKHYPGGPPSSGGDVRTGGALYATRSPWQGAVGSTMDNESLIMPYRQAVRDLAEVYALNVWEAGKTSQFSAFTALGMSDDGIHLSYSGERWVDGNPDHIAVQKNYGTKLGLGSNLSAYLHTVFPSDWTGDPWIAESDASYMPAVF